MHRFLAEEVYVAVFGIVYRLSANFLICWNVGSVCCGLIMVVHVGGSVV